MQGRDRIILYRLALETGLRWSEIKSLTKSSFDFEGIPATVTVRAAYSKNRKPCTLPLCAQTAQEIREYLRLKTPSAAALPIPRSKTGAVVIRVDLATAGIPVETEKGIADFHALRHTFITGLAKSGVHPRIAQALARHSSIDLTMNVYTHVEIESEAAAIDRLPDSPLRQVRSIPRRGQRTETPEK